MRASSDMTLDGSHPWLGRTGKEQQIIEQIVERVEAGQDVADDPYRLRFPRQAAADNLNRAAYALSGFFTSWAMTAAISPKGASDAVCSEALFHRARALKS